MGDLSDWTDMKKDVTFMFLLVAVPLTSYIGRVIYGHLARASPMGFLALLDTGPATGIIA